MKLEKLKPQKANNKIMAPNLAKTLGLILNLSHFVTNVIFVSVTTPHIFCGEGGGFVSFVVLICNLKICNCLRLLYFCKFKKKDAFKKFVLMAKIVLVRIILMEILLTEVFLISSFLEGVNLSKIVNEF